MILVDTSVWIQFFRADALVFSQLQAQMERQNILAAECVFAELLQGTKNDHERKMISQYWAHLPKKNETGLWMTAGALSAQNKYFSKGVGLIDAFLVAFSRKYKCTVWTLDKKLKSVLESGEIYR